MMKFYREMGLVFLVVALTGNSPVRAGDARIALSISTPISRQVFQRDAKEQAVIAIQGTVKQSGGYH